MYSFFLRSKNLRKTDNKVRRVQQISLLVILRNFLDLRKTVNLGFHYVKRLDNEQT